MMKVYTIPCHDRGYINFMLVLQSCSDSLHFVPSSSSETNAASSDCACHIGNMKVDKDLDMQGEEGEVNVKTEKGIASDRDECISIKEEEGIYSEEEEEEKEYMEIKKEEDIEIKEEVSLHGTV